METQGARVKSDRAGAWPPFMVLLKCICLVLGSLLSPFPVLTQGLTHVCLYLGVSLSQLNHGGQAQDHSATCTGSHSQAVNPALPGPRATSVHVVMDQQGQSRWHINCKVLCQP